MDKEGIMIYLCMKGQNEWLEEVKAYFQKSSYVLKVIEIDDWQNELSLTNQKGKILLEKIKQIQLKNKYLKELDIDEENIKQEIEKRAKAKQNKDFEKADKIRNALEAKGIILKDSKEGTSWDFKSLYNG